MLISPYVEMKGISKSFSAVTALNDVNFELRRGEVHVLFGENGAGKSTLISILAGVMRPTKGMIEIDGSKVEFNSVLDAQRHGVCAVFQEFSLVPSLTVVQNLYLGRELRHGPFLHKSAMNKCAKALFEKLGFQIGLQRRVSTLSRSEQQMVEIAKAFLGHARVLILDEPTASLTERETRRLFEFILAAKAQGVAIVYISHRIQEFSAIADRISVLRDGILIRTVIASETSRQALLESMAGRTIESLYPLRARHTPGDVILSLKGLHSHGVHGVDIEVRRGEILGVAGLVGSGKSRVWRSVLGLQPVRAGSVTLKGVDTTNRPTQAILRNGVFYMPSDRKAEGLQLAATAHDNLRFGLMNLVDSLSLGWFVSRTQVTAMIREVAERVGMSMSSLDRPVSNLSGGNQQKVLFGKGVGRDCDIYIFDEPTVGVDVTTRWSLYALINSIAESGKAVVVISSDLPEVLNLAHRVVVFSSGTISGELNGDDINEEAVLAHFFTEERTPA